ncbi:hypothetical protein Val02_50340 [Virgisporangium aliadipatigenens]|uniref:Magnesium transporter n=1 Tax=Virgisporangium aliadipatigenens TaxID=741659 RepID=A0A8J4DSR3_9ACTN|nr:CorA family divalent cation transporter [Virgisporangium aliadipatigenens]GIJ48148.1 hypothetical protein Val02_50340 [Virgisporangium aliadipatigenens]
MRAGASVAGPTAGGSARIRLYRGGVSARDGGTLADAVHAAREPGATAWLDVVDAGTDDIEALDPAPDLHDLALVDALEGPDRPSLRRYGTHLFVTAYPIAARLGRPRVSPVAAIIAVPTAITGFYGQNVPFPGSGQPAGVVASIGLMVASSLALYTVLRRRDRL